MNKINSITMEIDTTTVTPSYTVRLEDIANASDETVNRDLQSAHSKGLIYLRELAREIVKLKESV